MLSSFAFFALALLSFSYATPTLDDIEPGWLTLATTNGQKSQSSTHTGQIPEQSNTHVSQASASTLPDSNLLSRQTTKYFKNAETRARISQSWTKERKQKHAERMRLVSTGRKHTAKAKEKMRINHKSRKDKSQDFFTKQRISDSMKKYHTLKKQDN